MAGSVLSAPDRVHLLPMMRRQTNSAVHRRMNVLLLLDDGWPAERIAEALYIDAETVREHQRLYRSAGVTGLGRLTFVYKKPKCVPAKADAAVRRQFVMETLAPLMARASAERPLYFVDGTHPAYTGHPAFGWIKRGTTRELKSNHGRVNVNINGALSWPDREVVHQQAEKITSAAMVTMFDALAARHPGAAAISVVLDNASYNHSAEVKAYLARDGCRIRLVYLPPYAPNLNLIERLWWFFKKKTLWNEHYPTLAAFKAAIDRSFDDIAAYGAELAGLITDRFHFIGEESRTS